VTIPPPKTDAATVLVVSPDPTVRATACAMLHFSGYRSLVAETPRLAMSYVSQHGVEGVFFDLDFAGFTPTLLLEPSTAEGMDTSAEWLTGSGDHVGQRHLVLCGERRVTPDQIADAAEVGKTVTFLAKPFGLHPFRTALSHFTAEHSPSPARPAGATGAMLALPSRSDVEPPLGFQDPRAGRYGGGISTGRGTEHRRDVRFEWSCSAVVLGREEERAEICEISRTGLRIRKPGRELPAGTHCEISFVARIPTSRGDEYIGIRALGQVVWTAEGMTQIEAGITLHAVQPLTDYISLLANLFGRRG
jgi:hypothetical protein